MHGIIDKIEHKIDVKPLFEGKCLYEKDINEFPPSWKPFAVHFSKESKS